jgi:hypothetical protein|nr:MAG TPA: hypothetical protein [Caudoviricetes sp.]
MGLFGGKKEKKAISVFHYEGVNALYTDCPCKVKLNDTDFEIKSDKPEAFINLPQERIKSISVLEEPKFMQKYHGNAERTSKIAKKTYLIIEYVSIDNEDKMIAFWIWNVSGDALKLISMQNSFKPKPINTTL